MAQHDIAERITERNRDPRVDFWRGVAMAIIFMAHLPGNWWAWYIPARFGPSDAAEMFVFCSGFASAAAFGGTFLRHGWWVGTARVIHRVWQIYWCQIGLFIVVVAILFLGTEYGAGPNYLAKMNLLKFIDDPARGFVHLFTLTYVPNYFDILPMYMVVLAMLPIVMALHRIGGVTAAAAFVVFMWVGTHAFGWQFSAEWWSNRGWFFNPLGWALIFFTGYAISAGWIKAPAPSRWLILACIVFVLALIPVSHWPIWGKSEFFKEIRNSLKFGFGIEKTDFGLIRYVHFLALAYLAHCAFLTRQHWLTVRWLKPVMMLGQNALPVFLASMALARVFGIILDTTERSKLTVSFANIAGLIILVGVAYVAAYYKTQPWKKRPPAIVEESSPSQPAQARPLPAE